MPCASGYKWVTNGLQMVYRFGLIVFIDIYWFLRDIDALHLQRVTNGLQIWCGINRLRWFFHRWKLIDFLRFLCILRRITNGLQICYRFGVKFLSDCVFRWFY